MNNKKLNEEELEKVTGGETSFVYDPKGGLKDAIAHNLTAGAEYYAIQLVKQGMLAELKSVLDSAAVQNEAWKKAYIHYQIAINE